MDTKDLATTIRNQAGNAAWREFANRFCVHELFEVQVERAPDRVAVVCEDGNLTYGALNELANQVAWFLQKRGVGPEVVVGVCLERSIELVAVLLGVLKAGGAYAPLDPAYPRERLTFMLTNAQASILLTARNSSDPSSTQLLSLESHWSAIVRERSTNPLHRAGAQNLAYVIYTSGSTGQPKGVMIVHSALNNHMHWMQSAFPLSATDRVLQKTPFSFDASVWEFYAPLLAGACLVLARPGGHQESAYLVGTIVQEQISILQVVPTMLRVLLDEPAVGTCQSLRHVFCGGEELPFDLWARTWAALPAHTALSNLYGPTECTIDATAWTCERESQRQRIPIGTPIANTQIYLLDSRLEPVPTGVTGEVYIGGAGLARGYYQRADLTAECFLPDPFSPEPGQRFYKTGDFARFLPERAGVLEFLGRVDTQIKLRGFRIELREIEAVLAEQPGIQEAVVLSREDGQGNKRLVAYVVPQKGSMSSTEVDELRKHLRECLPAYMLPSLVVPLPCLPLTAHGKLDRGALPSPTYQSYETAPLTIFEEVLADIWADLLGGERPAAQVNFFDLGGHSLLAMRMLARVRSVFHIIAPLRTIFEHPTIAQLARWIEASRWEEERAQEPPLQAVQRDDPLPLSSAQQRLWFFDQLAPGNPLYNVAETWHLEGELHVAALAQVLNSLVERHEGLRTYFAVKDGQPSQVLASALRLPLPVVDLTGLYPAKQAQQLRQLCYDEARAPFDLARAPLLRTCLLRSGDNEHWLLVTLHHIITDDWSLHILLRELAAGYRAALTGTKLLLPDLPIQYADYVLWQRQWLQGKAHDQQLAYWQRQLAMAPTVLALPTDYPRPAAQSFRGDTHSFVLPSDLTRTIVQLSRREEVTLFMTLLAAFAIVLGRYSGQDDIVIGIPSANRTRTEIGDIIGFFVNTLPLRVDLSNHPTFRELLRRVREVALGAYEHQEVPFEQLVEAVEPERSPGHAPLCQVFFTLQNQPPTSLDLPGLRLQAFDEKNGTAKFDLTLEMISVENRLEGNVEYSLDLFKPETIQRLTQHYQTLLRDVAAQPDVEITRVELLLEAERHTMLEEWNATEKVFASRRCVHELVEEQVERRPDTVALVFRDEHVTYEEMNQRANRLAHYLCSSGIEVESLVGVFLERLPDLVVSLLSILKAGAAYVPLDPSYPADRIAYMMWDAHIAALLTTQEILRDALQEEPERRLIYLDDPVKQACLARQPAKNLINKNEPENLVYVIYTSGSTGTPKGVQVTHRGLCNLIHWHHQAFEVTPRDRATQLASLSFDAAGWEIWPYLAMGATVCLVEDAVRNSLPDLGSWLALQSITISFLPTPLAERFLDEDRPIEHIPGGLRVLLTGGDQLHRAPLKALPYVFVNNYGPTENTVVATSGSVTPLSEYPELPSIGRPIANTRVYVVGRDMQPVPSGVAGELYIGGAGLGRGYLRRPDLTAERFVPDPFSNRPGARLYKTGDLVRYRSDGNLDFIGRTDHQVKLRGFRIEPGEIEAVLRQHAGIKEAVVVMREDTPGEKRLVAYILPAPEMPLAISQLRHYLQARLPHYMIPAALVTLELLPLSPNGKLDRSALPPPPTERPDLSGSYVAPRNAFEEELAGIWAEVLGVERVGIYDNFFELGGHSLLATQLIVRIKNILQIDIPLQLMFEQPRVAELARTIALRQDRPRGVAPQQASPLTAPRGKDAMPSLAELDQLSDAEIDTLLSLMISEQEESD